MYASETIPGRHQAITGTNAGMLLIRPLGTNFSDVTMPIYTFPLKMHLKMSSGKWLPFCLGVNVLKPYAVILVAGWMGHRGVSNVQILISGQHSGEWTFMILHCTRVFFSFHVLIPIASKFLWYIFPWLNAGWLWIQRKDYSSNFDYTNNEPACDNLNQRTGTAMFQYKTK